MRSVILGIVALIVFSYGAYETSVYLKAKEEFFIALRNDDLPSIRRLLSNGVALDMKDGVGQTPLHVAAYKGTPETIKYLISKGARIDALDNRGGTPLHWAAIKGGVENIEALIEGGANINLEDKYGATPLHWAVSGIGVKNIVRFISVSYLISKHADVNAKDSSGKTALDIARNRRDQTMINLLEKAGR